MRSDVTVLGSRPGFSGLRWLQMALLASTSTVSLGTGSASAATALDASGATTINTPVSIDLSGSIVSAYTPTVTIATQPGHGSANVIGEVVTYVPALGFSGADSFTFTATDLLGPSTATVRVSVIGSVPTLDPSVQGVVGAQQRAALFSALTQITNFNRHLEELRTTFRGINTRGLTINGQPTVSRDYGVSSAARLASLAPIASSALRSSSSDDFRAAGMVQTAQTSPKPNTPIELPDRIGVFLNGNLSIAQVTGTGVHPDASPRTSSISTGIDYRLSQDAIIGIGGGFTDDTTDIGGGSKSTSTGFNITLYGTVRPVDPAYIDGQLGYGRIMFHSRRNAASGTAIALADPNANQIWGSLTGGWEFDAGPYTFGPYLRLNGSHTTIDAASEIGAGNLDISYGQQKVTSVLTVLGFRGDQAISTSVGIISPHVRVEYQHEFAGGQAANVGFANGSASGFLINGYPISRNYFTLGVGASFLTESALSVFVDYDALVGYTHQTNNSITLGVSGRF